MPVVLLVRHGQASAQGPDYDVLSEVGHEQARVVGAELLRRGLRDPIVVSGGLARQRDTATSALPDADVLVDDRWDEYDHLGLLSELADPTLLDGTPKGFQASLDSALVRWLETDGFAAFRSRVLAALQALLDSLPAGRDAMAFTSGGVIAAIVADLLGGGFVPLNRAAVNTGITKLTVGSGGPSLISFNDHAHLDRSLLTYR